MKVLRPTEVIGSRVRIKDPNDLDKVPGFVERYRRFTKTRHQYIDAIEEVLTGPPGKVVTGVKEVTDQFEQRLTDQYDDIVAVVLENTIWVGDDG